MRASNSLGGSTGWVLRSPKSKVGGAALDVFLDGEELFNCSRRLHILCCLFSSSSTSSLDPECDILYRKESLMLC